MAVEGKYGTITSSTKQFHPDEPVFLLRATDRIAVDAIREYADMCEADGCSSEHVLQVRQAADRIAMWQANNRNLVKKLPD